MDNHAWQSEISPNEIDIRLDKFIVDNFPDQSRSYINKLIKDGHILCNKKQTKPSYKLKENDLVNVVFPKLKTLDLEPVNISIDYIFEDDYLAVINKPPLIPVHAGSGINTPTLVNGLLYSCKNLSGIGGILRPGIVHRLDKETSGVMIVAKNDISHINLSKQFKERNIKKRYIALVHGVLRENEGLINLEIGRDKNNRVKISSNSNKLRNASTEWRCLSKFDGFSLIEAFPLTGRTHQIRVHLDLIGHPILGDKVYSKRLNINVEPKLKKLLGRHLLHASSIEFNHPKTSKRIKFSIDIPKDFDTVIKYLS